MDPMFILGIVINVSSSNRLCYMLSRATHVQMEDGSVILLHSQRPTQRLAISRQLLTPGKTGCTRGTSKKVMS